MRDPCRRTGRSPTSCAPALPTAPFLSAAASSLVELEQQYGVARDTLRKAVQVLKDEGLVETVSGMGVYVTALPRA